MSQFRKLHGPGRIMILGIGTLLCFSCAVDPESRGTPTAAEAPNPQRLLGQWVRADGGYVLEIRRVRSGGRLEATYHNPRPINVETAELRQEGERLRVFIELRDRGYPGSYYELIYNEKEDHLAGNYFQATQQAFYDVVFVRRPLR